MAEGDGILAQFQSINGHDIEVSIDGADGFLFWVMDHTDEEWIGFGTEDGRKLYRALDELYGDEPYEDVEY